MMLPDNRHELQNRLIATVARGVTLHFSQHAHQRRTGAACAALLTDRPPTAKKSARTLSFSAPSPEHGNKTQALPIKADERAKSGFRIAVQFHSPLPRQNAGDSPFCGSGLAHI
jgi:hypothetical protein